LPCAPPGAWFPSGGVAAAHGCADSHAKNFSIFLRQGGACEMTLFYDVLSAWTDLPHRADSEAPQTEKPLIPLRIKGLEEWWPGAESNHRHADFQSAALTN
jgi:hypothetical protein